MIWIKWYTRKYLLETTGGIKRGPEEQNSHETKKQLGWDLGKWYQSMAFWHGTPNKLRQKRISLYFLKLRYKSHMVSHKFEVYYVLIWYIYIL